MNTLDVTANQEQWAGFFASLCLPEPYRLRDTYTEEKADYYRTLATFPPEVRLAELKGTRHNAALAGQRWLCEDLDVSIPTLEALVSG